MPYEDVAVFIAKLRTRKASSALALELCILTAARSGEIPVEGVSAQDGTRADLVAFADCGPTLDENIGLQYGMGADHGIALVQDMWDPGMLPTHLFKRRWRAHAERLGYDCRDVAGYFSE